MKTRLIFSRPLGAALLAIALSIVISGQSYEQYIKGVVQSPSGSLSSSVWVIASQNGAEKGRSLTGDDGKYYINNVSDGVCNLEVYRGNALIYRGQVNLSAGNRRHDIVIR